jgi:hypothetical protein
LWASTRQDLSLFDTKQNRDRLKYDEIDAHYEQFEKGKLLENHSLSIKMSETYA